MASKKTVKATCFVIVCDEGSGELNAYIEDKEDYIKEFTGVLFYIPIFDKRKKGKVINKKLKPITVE